MTDGFGDVPAVCMIDVGNNGMVIPADRMFPPRKHCALILVRKYKMQLAFEKYLPWKAQHGYVRLPRSARRPQGYLRAGLISCADRCSAAPGGHRRRLGRHGSRIRSR